MRWLHTSLLYSCVLAVDYTHDWPLYRAAFGSCNKQDKPQPLWPVIGAAAPQLWLWTGDAVYAHGSAAALARAVDRQRRNANYSAFAKGVVVDGAWDDHDLGVNDAGRGVAELAARRRAYVELFDDAARRRERAEAPRRAHVEPDVRVVGALPKAKRRLLALLYATNASGVALLSGDVHHAEVAAPAPGPVCGDVVEVTSSGLTHAMSTRP
ncbi:hypothetical protein JL722_2511 [Aureococcus anophagefferens]|nr:hypothetical protein JL722_2511 [Aureococcus anophagefferens]